MSDNRPHSRKRGEASGSGSVNKRGEGIGSGRLGNGSDRPSRPTRSSGGYEDRPTRSSNSNRGSRGPSSKLWLLLVAILLIRFCTSNVINNNSSTGSVSTPKPATPTQNTTTSTAQSFNPPTTNYVQVNSSEITTSSAEGQRDKYTTILGNGQDTVTIMIYMCGSDLESNYGMSTADLNEMLYATTGTNLNIIVETGGAKKWKNNVMSNRSNQRWQIADGQIYSLDKNVGSKDMTDPTTLADFIQFASSNYPANRNMLILWDHGGGSISGYGYDELYPYNSMTVNKIASALQTANVQFDVIGFDACLMANAETALAVEPYADYLIASEETEPGTGWYYTDWLTALSKNTSMSTVEIGKQIIDDFIKESAASSSRDKTSLSIIDLAEFYATVPDSLKNFAVKLNSDLQSDNYQPIVNARSTAKEFASSNKIDQIDLVHFCKNLNTEESAKLAQDIQNCVKYNRTNNMNNAYGLSIYFPYNSIKHVSTMAGLYDAIGMDVAYTDAIKSFATMEAGGQFTTGTTTNSLFDILSGQNAYSSSSSSSSDADAILNLLLGNTQAPQGSSSYGYSLSDMLGGNGGVSDLALDIFSALIANRGTFDTSALEVTTVDDNQVIALSETQWSMITGIKQSVWVDDGSGYIDLGLDNIFDFDDHGNLLMSYDGNWIGIDGQIVSYYMLSDEYVSDSNYTTTGYVPCLYNDALAHLLIEFTPENPDGIVTGVQLMYDTGVDAKVFAPEVGATITYLADYYDYNGNYSDSYIISDDMVVSEDGLQVQVLSIENETLLYGYCLTDIYNTSLWTPMLHLE